MNSPKVTIKDLPNQLLQIGLRTTAGNLDDLLARAVRLKWSHLQLLEEIARTATDEKGARNLERRSRLARIGRFKSMADFDWNWEKGDRSTAARAVVEARLYSEASQSDLDRRQRAGEDDDHQESGPRRFAGGADGNVPHGGGSDLRSDLRESAATSPEAPPICGDRSALYR